MSDLHGSYHVNTWPACRSWFDDRTPRNPQEVLHKRKAGNRDGSGNGTSVNQSIPSTGLLSFHVHSQDPNTNSLHCLPDSSENLVFNQTVSPT